jgi:hypothetical protein
VRNGGIIADDDLEEICPHLNYSYTVAYRGWKKPQNVMYDSSSSERDFYQVHHECKAGSV